MILLFGQCHHGASCPGGGRRRFVGCLFDIAAFKCELTRAHTKAHSGYPWSEFSDVVAKVVSNNGPTIDMIPPAIVFSDLSFDGCFLDWSWLDMATSYV